MVSKFSWKVWNLKSGWMAWGRYRFRDCLHWWTKETKLQFSSFWETVKNAEHPVIYFNLFIHFFERKKILLSWAVNASFNWISELNVLCIFGNCTNAQIVYPTIIFSTEFCQIEGLVWNRNMTNLILLCTLLIPLGIRIS